MKGVKRAPRNHLCTTTGGSNKLCSTLSVAATPDERNLEEEEESIGVGPPEEER